MKHFVIEITYKAPLEQIDAAVGDHRQFLQGGYDLGLLLFSGPQNPRTGGIIIARAESLEAIQDLFKKDPYQARGLASYRFIEFNPVKRQNFLESWTAA
jgi:uncharacterized protein YciI